MAFAHGIVFNCNGQFIKPVCEDMGYSRQQFSINQTILSCATMVMALISGKIYNKFNVQKTMCVFSIALVAGYTGYSLCTSLPMFYVLSAVVGFSIGGMTMIPLSLIVSNWFHEKRGLAIGIAFMGSGVGGMVLQPITASIVQAMGWRTAYQCLGVLMFCTIVPCSFFVLKRSPADVGLKPLGDGVEIKTGGVGEGKMLSEIITTPRFWVFAICAMGTAMATSGLMQNINPHLTDSGYSVAVAATITSCCMALWPWAKCFWVRSSTKWALGPLLSSPAAASCWVSLGWWQLNLPLQSCWLLLVPVWAVPLAPSHTPS